MAGPVDAVVLSSGGVKSLVAAATLGRATRPPLLFIDDGRPSIAQHHAAFVRQCEYMDAARRLELAAPRLLVGDTDGAEAAPMGRLEFLAAAASRAARLGARRLVWAVSVGEDFEAASRIAELQVLIEHAIEVETGHSLRIESPLLELTPPQIIEAGEQLQAPWRATRSCQTSQPAPCGTCAGCVGRAAAFAAAGVEDPLAVHESA